MFPDRKKSNEKFNNCHTCHHFLAPIPRAGCSPSRNHTLISVDNIPNDHHGDVGITYVAGFPRHRALHYPPSRAMVIGRASEGVAWYVVGFSRPGPHAKWTITFSQERWFG